jgi:hypothetical protein
MIQIDVHPAGKNPTNTPRTLPTPVHIRPAYASCGWSPYVATFHESSTELSRPTAPEKRAPDTIHNTPADRSTSPYPASLLSRGYVDWPMKQWGAKPNIYQRQATSFTGPISPACDRYVQYFLTGTNPSVLN